MNRNRIDRSTSISEIGYDAAAGVLEIKFFGGNVYEFYAVPKHVAEALQNPPTGSIGKYFDTHVRHVFPFMKL